MILPTTEYPARAATTQSWMAKQNVAALLLTTEPDIRYLTGFLTRFWESPTRPWFVILPATGQPIAVIPSIGAALMARTWVTDIRTWDAPDLVDDGITLLSDTLREVAGTAPIATPMEMETHLRMPLSGWAQLTAKHHFATDHGQFRNQRMTKSVAEIALIRAACATADRAFARLPEIAKIGTPLSQVFRRFQMLCLDEGADCVPYLAGGAGPLGYSDVISPASDKALAQGDVLMLDTGLQRDGYFCDFDRNVSLGIAQPIATNAYARLITATDAAFDLAKPGTTLAALWQAMAQECDAAPNAGRMGHGLGQQLTEWPSILPDDHTPLTPGMVLTLEPSIATGPDTLLVHEENIVITETGADYLSTPAPRQLPNIA